MKINLIVNSFPSASETFLFNLVTGLESRGHKVRVCALTRSKHMHLYVNKQHEWSGNLLVLSYYTIFRLIPGFNIIKVVNNCRRFGCITGLKYYVYQHFAAHGNPDLIHFAYSGIGITFLPVLDALKDKNIKLVVSCRGSAEKVKPIVESTRKDDLRQLFVKCDLIHCVSEDMILGLIQFGLDRNKAFVNYPSVNTEYFKRCKPYEINNDIAMHLVTTGRLHFQKGYVFALLAIKNVIDKGYNLKYTIIGEGADYSMLKYLIQELNLSSYVILTGKIGSDEVKNRLEDADIFILPSLYEGIANSALEAMSMQIPVISTKSGGMAEVIVNWENGIIVQRFDSLAIAESIIKLIEYPELRLKISNASRKIIVEKFNLKKQLDCYESTYMSRFYSF